MANGFGFGVGSCHCGAACDKVGHCVLVEWDLEYLDFASGCIDGTYNASSGSAVFYFDPDDQTASKLVCLDGTPISDDSSYKTSGLDESWDIPTPGQPYPLVISGSLTQGSGDLCFGMQILMQSDFAVDGLQWPSADGTYNELTEDLSAQGGLCDENTVTIRGTITMTDNWPSTAEACGCP